MLHVLAERHGRVVTAADLAAVGFDQNALVRLRRAGRLVRIVHGTYAVPPVDLSPFLLACRAALRYAGAGARLVGESALACVSVYPEPDVPEVGVPRVRCPRSTPGVTVRRLSDSWLALPRLANGLVVQDPARAVVWACSRMNRNEDRQAVVCAAVSARVATTAAVCAALTVVPKIRGRGAIAHACADVDAGCESPAEIAYLHEVERRYRLPRGQRQFVVAVPGGRVRRIDVRYGRVLVEVDGAYHGLPSRRAADEARDVVLAALGFHVLRIDAAEIRRDPQSVARAVADAIARYA